MRAARAANRTQSARPSTGSARNLIGLMAPGTNPMMLGPDSAMRIAAGTELIFQIHYTTNGDATTERSRVGMIFADGPPESEVRVGQFRREQVEP
jgi:hypothetical protein